MFHYDGSLTVPPCSEVVKWIIVNDPQPISAKQLYQFNKKWMGYNSFALGNGNNRATQPLGTRTIHYLGSSAVRIAASIVGLVMMTQAILSI